MVRLVVDNDFRSLSEGEKVAGHRRLLKTVASLKDNDETDTITAPLFRIGRCGDARLVNWKEVSCLRVFFPSICYIHAVHAFMHYIQRDHIADWTGSLQLMLRVCQLEILESDSKSIT